MNDELKFEILQLCSGHYLSKNIPDDWEILTEEEQNEFLENNVWQPLEGYPTSSIWNAIESSATVTQHFIEDLLGL